MRSDGERYCLTRRAMAAKGHAALVPHAWVPQAEGWVHTSPMRWLLEPASAQGVALRGDWYLLMLVGAAVAVYVYAAIGWCVVAYRRRAGRQAEQFSGNTPLEIAYVVAPLLIVGGLFAATLVVERPVDRVEARPAYRVAVTAFRWSWRFAYGGAVETTGTPAQPPTLYLPLGRTTEIELRSADVTHSFWVPAFLFKRDAIPGLVNAFDLTPSRAGVFPARCAQFCGLDHAHMTFVVDVVPEERFRRFLGSGGAVTP